MAVIANLSMSLDGFVADHDGGVSELFGWYGSGPVEVTDFGGRTSKLHEPSASFFRQALESAGCFLVGRRLYDLTNGWGGKPPSEAPMVVLTHEPPDEWPRGVPIEFVSGVEAAVARARDLAGGKDVSVAGAETGRAVLAAGLLDEIVVNPIPVIKGDGVPWFAGTGDAPWRLSDPEVVEAPGVTHLRYRVVGRPG